MVLIPYVGLCNLVVNSPTSTSKYKCVYLLVINKNHSFTYFGGDNGVFSVLRQLFCSTEFCNIIINVKIPNEEKNLNK